VVLTASHAEQGFILKEVPAGMTAFLRASPVVGTRLYWGPRNRVGAFGLRAGEISFIMDGSGEESKEEEKWT